jgi:hypothetical protein
MNKYLFTLLMITPLLSSGQFIKGDKFIGGTFRLSSQTPTKSDQSSTIEVNGFSIYPTMGFLLNEKFAIGGQIGYSYLNTVYNNNQSSQSKYNSKRFSLGLISRRYFSISDKFIFSINGQVNFDRGKETNTNSTSESITQNYQIGINIQPCFIFFPSPKWGIETSIGSIGYSYSRNLSTDLGQNYINLSYGTINLGLSYYFRKVN